MKDLILNIADVISFTKEVISVESVNVHPDDDFTLYVNFKTGERTYTDDEAEKRNELMEQCFEICKKNNVDIYSLMNDIHLRLTGLDKYIPLSGNAYDLL